MVAGIARPERLLFTSSEATVRGLGDADLPGGQYKAAHNGVVTRDASLGVETDRPPKYIDWSAPADGGQRNQRRGFAQWSRRYVAFLAATDAVVGALATTLPASFSNRLTRPPETLILLALLGAVVWPLAIGLSRGYAVSGIGVGTEEPRAVVRAAAALIIIGAFPAGLLSQEALLKLVVIATPMALALSLTTRYAARKVLHRRQAHGRNLRHVVVVGSHASAQQLKWRLDREPYCGMKVIGVCLPQGSAIDISNLGVPVLGDLQDAAAVIRRIHCDAIAVTTDGATRDSYLRALSWALEGTGVEMLVDPGLVEVAGPRMHIRPLMGVPLLHIDEPHFTGWRRLVKRTFDILLTAVGLVLIAPLMLVIASAIKLQDGGPVIFRQPRIGRGGETFTMLKFRSMVVDAESRKADLMAINEGKGGLFKLSHDPRITPLGKFLRDFSLDELPQLFNVLRGSMSLVGPRPHLASELEQMPVEAKRRCLVTPGLTGLWQVSGRSDLEGDEAVRLDLRYVENWSLTMDVLIIWKTVSAVVRRAGAR
jgi:exopolysaccharide biosynthesis polyprenyl glycosylphosphotransferase